MSKWNRKKIIEVYRKVCIEEGQTIPISEFARYSELPATGTVQVYFSSMYELYYLAGFISEEYFKWKVKKEVYENVLPPVRRKGVPDS